MTVADAYKKVMKNNADKKAISCYEYNNYYAFELVPKDAQPNQFFFDSVMGVNKSTGAVIVFSPISVEPSELNNPKPIDFIDSSGNVIRTKDSEDDEKLVLKL